jgi:hypothetical protein
MAYTLLTVECGGIQSYVFGSNRLLENVGASYLVAQATEAWIFDALDAAGLQHNVTNPRADDPFVQGHLFDDGNAWQAEVIYFGGGNCTILFRDQNGAKKFTCQLSRRALCDAPNLRLEIHRRQWNGNEPLGKAVGELRKEMKAAISRQPQSAPLLGLGVTAVCQETGLPAVDFEDERYLSAEVLAKHKAADKAKRQLTQALLGENSGYAFPSELDKLGRSRGERSYIAVVHADGNSMGERIREIGEERDNRKYIERIRAFSQATKRISLAAMKAVVELLTEKSIEGTHIEGAGTVADLEFVIGERNKMLLPVRPIIFGGDDTTFVCDGRIGVALAVEYLRAFEEAAESESREFAKHTDTADLAELMKLTACAGVAIVKSHYPFARAYALSEELCSAAKKFRREAHVRGSALDWYFSTSGLYGELETMREREYRTPHGSLTLRPVALHDDDQDRVGAHRWSVIERLTREFQSGEWAEKRNKAKLLRDALRQGPEATERALSVYELRLPELPNFTESGWCEGVCGYFDALELMDIHIPLGTAQEEGAQ